MVVIALYMTVAPAAAPIIENKLRRFIAPIFSISVACIGGAARVTW
jgi:hypothetical protein